MDVNGLTALERSVRMAHLMSILDVVKVTEGVVCSAVEKALVHLGWLAVVQISAVGGHVDLVDVSLVSLRVLDLAHRVASGRNH